MLWGTCERTANSKFVVPPVGWTTLYHDHDATVDFLIATKVAAGTETDVTITFAYSGGATSDNYSSLAVVEVSGQYDTLSAAIDTSSATHTIPTVTPDAGTEALLLIGIANHNPHAITVFPSGYTALEGQGVVGMGRMTTHSLHIATASGGYSSSITFAGSDYAYKSHVVFTALAPEPTADFVGTPLSGTTPLSVAFTDLSTQSPTSWLWDFGDGSTSTSQNPTHSYTLSGNYTVSLTATNANGSDTETKVAYLNITTDVGFTPAPAGRATVEIYVHDPAAARWDEANWDEAVWANAGWVDVTPMSMSVSWQWGVTDASRGILSIPDAASVSIEFLDDDRVLDPANAESPYFGDIVPFLPVRINHDGYTIKTGVAESIGHEWNEPQGFDFGYMRVTDNIARMAQGHPPDDTDLGDTLYTRARAALDAAGLSDIQIVPALLGVDPALVPWVTGTDQSVWEWVIDAARQVLYIPYIDRHNQLGFRPYASPLNRLGYVDDTELVSLQSIVTYQGNYSIVKVLDADGVTLVTREVTPKPVYGARVYDDRATKPTPDSTTWAETVLNDRSLTSLRWVPGEAYPTVSTRTRALAQVEGVEQISVTNNSTAPDVAVDGVVLGGTIRLEAMNGQAAQWWIKYEMAELPEVPLIVSGSDPPEYLLRTGGVDYLYRSL